jgi:protein-S-isoprenylcysteine O-methyltransferase Ste14
MGLLSGEDRRETAIAWTFVGVQLVLIVVIVVLPAGDAWSLPPSVDLLARLVEAIGLAVLAIGLINLGRSLTPLPTPVPDGRLQSGGLYRWVRHPIYSGIIALAVGSAARSGNPWTAVAAAALTGWFMSKARWEEQRLRARYPDYASYAARTPRFVPFWPFGADRGARYP